MSESQFFNDYKAIKVVGEGTYGKVYKCESKTKSGTFAVKLLKNFSCSISSGINYTTLREISILRELDHKNIIKLLELIVNEDGSHIMVFNYFEYDLRNYLKTIKFKINFEDLKNIFKQIVSGVDYLHSNGIIHRDIKTSNIMVDPDNKDIKIIDFGLSRHFTIPFRVYSKDVGTLYYKAPEVLMGSYEYGLGYDIWSLGIILVEMVFGIPLVKGSSQFEQLIMLFQIFGTPTSKTWNSIEKIPDFSHDFPKFKGIGIKRYLNKSEINKNYKEILHSDIIEESYFNLLNKILVMDPNQRILANEILSHDFFILK